MRSLKQLDQTLNEVFWLELRNPHFSVLTDIRGFWLMNYFPSDNHYPPIKMLPASHYCLTIFMADIWLNCLGSTKPDVHSMNLNPATYSVYSSLFTSCSTVKEDILLLLQNFSTVEKNYQKNASLFATINSSNIYHMYVNNIKLLLPHCTHLKQSHSVTFNFNWHFKNLKN